jgi:asparagine synthase (glutamine-hydrolysing)
MREDMCGIAGGISRTRALSDGLAAALSSIRHRGPDDRSEYVRNQLAFGMCRLAIIDVESGQQPAFNEDGTMAVIFNGEIYNYRELKRQLTSLGHRFKSQSDTETLVHLYEEYGTDMCSHLRGMFAFAIWDERRQQLFMARDRLGKKPLYYAQTNNSDLVFASELKALRPLLKSVGFSEEINSQSIYDYLSLGAIPQPSTIYRGVECLPPGTWLKAGPEGIRKETYWRLESSSELKQPSYEEAKQRTRDLISDSVKVRLRSDVPLGVFLSGGLDSSIVAYEAVKVIGSELRTFTVAMSDKGLDESAVAKRTALALGVKNDVLKLDVVPERDLFELVRHFDQPYADSSAIPTLAISRAAKQHVTVALNGDGGDEIFGGYRRHVAASWNQAFRHMPLFVSTGLSNVLERLTSRRRSMCGFASRFLRGLSHSTGERYLHWTTDLLKDSQKRLLWRKESQRSTEDWLGELSTGHSVGLKQQMLLDCRVNLLSDLLVKMDMATMAASVEGRSPLMDHNLAEYTMSLPDRYLVRGNRSKCLLRDAYTGLLPEEVVRGAKRGFEVPLRNWLTRELRPLLFDLLGRPNAFVRNWIDGRFVDQLLNNPPANGFNWDGLMYSLLVMEIWFEQQSVAQSSDLPHQFPIPNQLVA